jgi:beta-phosphoglucomutase-like phosphatase (HAD superfamily)
MAMSDSLLHWWKTGSPKPRPLLFVRGAATTISDNDTRNGILSASAAGMRVIAVPNPEFPPGEDALAAARVLPSIKELTVDSVEESLPG